MKGEGKMGIKTQVISLFILLLISFLIYFFGLGNINILENRAFFFTHGLVLLLLGFFIIERHFTKQRDIIVNCIAVLMSLIAIGKGTHEIIWYGIIIYTATILYTAPH